MDTSIDDHAITGNQRFPVERLDYLSRQVCGSARVELQKQLSNLNTNCESMKKLDII